VNRIIIVSMIRAGLIAMLLTMAMFSVSCGGMPPDSCLAAVQGLANEVEAAKANKKVPDCQEELDAWCDCLPGNLAQQQWSEEGPSCFCLAMMTLPQPCPEWQEVDDHCNGTCLSAYMYNSSQAQKDAADKACQSSTRKRKI
jgi:hypothetical protein